MHLVHHEKRVSGWTMEAGNKNAEYYKSPKVIITREMGDNWGHWHILLGVVECTRYNTLVIDHSSMLVPCYYSYWPKEHIYTRIYIVLTTRSCIPDHAPQDYFNIRSISSSFNYLFYFQNKQLLFLLHCTNITGHWSLLWITYLVLWPYTMIVSIS